MKNVYEFINWYYGEGDNFFIVAIDNKTNAINNYYHTKSSFKKYYEQILLENSLWNKSLYFTINSFKDKNTCEINDFKRPKKTKSNVSHIKSIVFDFDEPETSKEDCVNLIKTLNMNPTYILETSPMKFQVCYRLNDENIDFKEYEIVNKTLAKKFNSDINVCSIEKVFRLPFTTNHKNGFETRIIKIDIENSYDFSMFSNKLNQFLVEDEKLAKYYEILKNKNIKNTQASSKKPKDSTKSITKKTPMQNNSIDFNEDVYLDAHLIAKYQSLLKFNQDDASVADILYIKQRAKDTNNYDDIFNEIITIRNILEKPLKRDLSSYYDDRAQFMY